MANNESNEIFEPLTVRDLAEDVWQTAEDHGWHDEGLNDTMPPWVANLHGEVSELWEAYRRGRLEELCDKAQEMEAIGLSPLTCAEEELADIIIRALDVAEQMRLDIEGALRAKARFNKERSFRHGGKIA